MRDISPLSLTASGHFYGLPTNRQGASHPVGGWRAAAHSGNRTYHSLTVGTANLRVGRFFGPCDSIRPFSDGAPIMWSNSGGCPALARWFMSHIVTVTRLIGAGAVKEARTAFIVARLPDAG